MYSKIYQIFILGFFSFLVLALYLGSQDELFSSEDQSAKSTLTFYLTVREEDLYDEDHGIFTNYDWRGDEAECPVHIEVTNADGENILTQDAGMKVNGQTSRAYPQKSLKLTARRSYDEEHGKFEYPLFGADSTRNGSPSLITKYNAVILRSVCYGHDTTGSLTIAAYDLATQAGLVDTSATRPANVYINGTYAGFYILTQPQNAASLAEMYDISDRNTISVTQKDSNQHLETDKYPEAVEDYYEFTEAVQAKETLTTEDLREIEKELDIDQFFTYIAVETLLGNADWPHNNFRLWKCDGNGTVYQDGKWRYLFYDPDHVGASEEHVRAALDSIFYGTSRSHILPQLMQNESMRQKLASTYRQLMRTVFTDDNIQKAFDQAENEIHDDMQAYLSSGLYSSYLLDNEELIAAWSEEEREEVLHTKISNICNNRQIISDYFEEHYGISLLD